MKSISGYKPLLCVDNGVLVSRGDRLFMSSIDLDYFEPLCKLPTSAFPRVRLLERILRGGIQTATPLAGNSVLVVRGREIWRTSLASGTCELEFQLPEGRKLLNLTSITGVQGFDNVVCFGEYFFNPAMEPVRIWTRPIEPSGKWSIACVFGAGEINHIHNIIADAKMGGAWVLTGDFGHGAAIWFAKNGFGTIAPILRGAQNCRAAWLCAGANQSYMFATDTQMAPNTLNVLRASDGGWSAEPIYSLEGSSIYAGQGTDCAVFSTTVEPGEPSGKFIKDLFDVQLGPGIRSRFAAIYTIDSEGTLTELFRRTKDRLPFRLFQFGTFSFPGGVFPVGYIYAYGIALVDYDDTCLIFQKERD